MKNKNVKGQEVTEQASEVKEKPKFIEVPVEVLGKHKGKNYIDPKGIAYNPENGNLSVHLGDNHTLIFKEAFQRNKMHILLSPAEKVERAAMKAPTFEKPSGEKSKARMLYMGERDGHTFVGVSGKVKYEGNVRGLVINLDDKHMTILDSEVLSKELGITVSPIVMERERSTGLGR